MTPPHTLEKGYNYNYIIDAAQLYWAARWFELNKSLDEKEAMIDMLLIRRLRQAADKVMKQGIQGLEHDTLKTPATELQIYEQLTGKKDAKG